jgi:DNA-binding LacI/PurR family transcriptional regulator
MANRKRGTPSIVDVAKKAGFSVTTVSRVFNKRDTVNAATAERILKVAEQMGFELSADRPGPKPQPSGPEPFIRFLHFMDPAMDGSETNYTLLPIKNGVNAAAAEAGMKVVYDVLGPDDKALPAAFDGGKTAGAVLLGHRPSASLEAELREIPCCWMMTGIVSPPWGDHVMPDHREVGAMAARYLAERGHKKIAMIQLCSGDRVHRFREEGFRHEMEAYPEVEWTSLSGTDNLSDAVPGFVSESVLAEGVVERIKAEKEPFTGCFFDHDRTLFVLYPKLVKAGILPERDLDVLSCNKLEVYRRQLPFAFPSIDVHFETVGAMSVAQILWRIRHPETAARARTLVLPDLNPAVE